MVRLPVLVRTLIAVTLFLVLCCAQAHDTTISVEPLPGTGDLAAAFLTYFEPVEEDFTLRMPAYELPLNVKSITNFSDVAGRYLADDADRKMLAENGFVVVEGGPIEDISVPYGILRDQELPIYVTTDTLLHLFHIQFDETLKEIEEKVFYPDILAVTRSLLDHSEKQYRSMKGELKEAARRNVAYFSVAMRQYDPDFNPPSFVKDVVKWECQQIEAHKGLPDYRTARENALFRIPEDYSQYKPRGHYTRSETLKKYFRGMMWYGRMSFLVKGHEKFGEFIPPAEALTDRETARIQTLQSLLISAAAGEVKLKDERRVAEVWDRIYSVTAFYAGLADDLTLYDYREALRAQFGTSFKAESLLEEEAFNKMLLILSEMRQPLIFSGTGGAGVDPGDAKDHVDVSREKLDEILTHTQGFRFMGQRYIPDSYILGEMVSPGVGTIPRLIPERFTSVFIPDERIQPDLFYTIRGFPCGLDVFSVLGSDRADHHVRKAKDHEYPKYDGQLKRLREKFSKISASEWNKNLYWSWLYALKTLTEPRGEGYQTYQQSVAWEDRQLNSALASWASLRHDTILYAKQSYTPQFMTTEAAMPDIPPPPPPPKGLVEPQPAFFARMLTTARMARTGLTDLKVLTPESSARIEALVRLLEQLYDLCSRQVANEPLTERDNLFLADFSNRLKGTIGDVDSKGLKTTLICDVHTDVNSKKVLEEGSGYVDYIVVAYKRAEGDVVLAVGPVLSYYEFKHPMNDRLTDEKWRKMLKSDTPPIRPIWNSSFTRMRH